MMTAHRTGKPVIFDTRDSHSAHTEIPEPVR